jgi:hypothetical protein
MYFSWYSIFITAVLLYLLVNSNQSTAILPGIDEYATWIDATFNTQTGIPITFKIGQLGFIILHSIISVLWEVKFVNEILPNLLRNNYFAKFGWRREKDVIHHAFEAHVPLIPKRNIEEV